MIINGKDTRAMKTEKELRYYRNVVKSIIREVERSCKFIFYIRIQESKSTDSIYGTVNFHNFPNEVFTFTMRNHKDWQKFEGYRYFVWQFKYQRELRNTMIRDFERVHNHLMNGVDIPEQQHSIVRDS